MHSMATGHGNSAPKAFLGSIPSAPNPAPDLELPKTDLSVRFQDPLVTTNPAGLMCLPTDSTNIPSVLMAKTPPSYQLGRMTRTPGAFMAFMTSPGSSKGADTPPLAVPKETPREIFGPCPDPLKCKGPQLEKEEQKEEDSDEEEEEDSDGTNADLNSVVNMYNQSGSTYEEDCKLEEAEEAARDAALNAAISGPTRLVAIGLHRPSANIVDKDTCEFPPGCEVRNIDSLNDDDEEDVFYDTVAFNSDDHRFTQLGPNHFPIIDAELNLHEAEDAVARTPFHIATGATEFDSSAIQGWASAAFTAMTEWDNVPPTEAVQKPTIFDDLTDDDSDEDEEDGVPMEEEDSKPAAKDNKETPPSNPKVPHLNF
jgi:hypothetical protein